MLRLSLATPGAAALALAAISCGVGAEPLDEVLAVHEAELKCRTQVPEEIAAPDDTKRAFGLGANGVQIYVCQAAADGTTRWVLSHVQRLETAGGLMPSGTCTPGAIAEVEYTALYAFFEPKRKP